MAPRLFLPILILFMSACRADFDVARDKLGPFRIVGVGVEEIGAECPVATAAIWSGYGAYHLDSPKLDWFLNGVPLGTGWDVPVCSDGELTLVVRDAEGHGEEARLTVKAREKNRVLNREDVVLSDLDLESRRAVDGVVVETSVPVGSATRVEFEGLLNGDSVSWISPENQAHVLPLNVSTTDFLMEDWEEDSDGMLLSRAPLAGPSSHFALIYDGNGANDFLWVDLVFGMEDSEFLRHEGRLIASQGISGVDEIVATVEKTAEGYRLSELLPGDGVPRFFPCMGTRTSFSLDWIANGRCSLAELDGQQITLEIW